MFEDKYSMNFRNRPFKAKPTRPTIEAEVDDLGWQIFVDAWARYKRISELEDMIKDVLYFPPKRAEKKHDKV